MVLGESTSQGILIRKIDILNELKGTPAGRVSGILCSMVNGMHTP